LQEQLKQHKGLEAVHLRSQDGQALLCLLNCLKAYWTDL